MVIFVFEMCGNFCGKNGSTARSDETSRAWELIATQSQRKKESGSGDQRRKDSATGGHGTVNEDVVRKKAHLTLWNGK